MATFFYVPLESLKARYTDQLCQHWMPDTFASSSCKDGWAWEAITAPLVSDEIKVGSVLDGVNRGLVSLQQIQRLLTTEVRTDDVVFFQDFFTPGIEALLYLWHLQGIKPRLYAMCHAQSVDEYDFTYPMRSWMRPIELGWSRAFAGLFVASTIHRDQLKAAGVECPIHVVGLPIDARAVMRSNVVEERQRDVVFSSRLNNEKNPFFMLTVAKVFLYEFPDWTWTLTTSAENFSSEVPGVLQGLQDMTQLFPGRFRLLRGLSKPEYYHALASARIQFNSSLQDYVSWTLLEATAMGCSVVYPAFRSFTECLPSYALYHPFSVPSALQRLGASRLLTHDPRPLDVCDRGRRVEMAIMLRNWQGPEVNVWHQPNDYFAAVGLL